MRISRRPYTTQQRSLTWMKVALATVGIVTWAYGVREDDHRVRWLGIAFLACAFVLRFFFRRRRGDENEREENQIASDG